MTKLSLLFIIWIVCALSLLSYSPHDPGFINDHDGDIHNLLGADGAYIADIILVGIGWPGAIALLIILAIAVVKPVTPNITSTWKINTCLIAMAIGAAQCAFMLDQPITLTGILPIVAEYKTDQQPYAFIQNIIGPTLFLVAMALLIRMAGMKRPTGTMAQDKSLPAVRPYDTRVLNEPEKIDQSYINMMANRLEIFLQSRGIEHNNIRASASSSLALICFDVAQNKQIAADTQSQIIQFAVNQMGRGDLKFSAARIENSVFMLSFLKRRPSPINPDLLLQHQGNALTKNRPETPLVVLGLDNMDLPIFTALMPGLLQIKKKQGDPTPASICRILLAQIISQYQTEAFYFFDDPQSSLFPLVTKQAIETFNASQQSGSTDFYALLEKRANNQLNDKNRPAFLFTSASAKEAYQNPLDLHGFAKRHNAYVIILDDDIITGIPHLSATDKMGPYSFTYGSGAGEREEGRLCDLNSQQKIQISEWINNQLQ